MSALAGEFSLCFVDGYVFHLGMEEVGLTMRGRIDVAKATMDRE